MRIIVLGTRGFPGVQGGVERHCENLYPQLVKLGCEVIVFGRSPYTGKRPYVFKGVKVIPLPCPKNKFLEAFFHTLKGIFTARAYKPDVIHIHAIGPSIFIPLAKLLGFNIVMTNHGPDYMRKKWNLFAKAILRLGESFASCMSDAMICVSASIAESIKQKYHKLPAVIPNGVNMPALEDETEVLRDFGLESARYILSVGRLVPEKGFHDLIKAFSDTRCSEKYKLVIAGEADHEDKYSRALKEESKKNPDVIFTGFLGSVALAQLYKHAQLFVLPSYHEGLPIALLEAMSYGLSCIASDIPANKEVPLEGNRFFKPAHVKEITGKIEEFLNNPLSDEAKTFQSKLIAERFDWNQISPRVLDVYREVMAKDSSIQKQSFYVNFLHRVKIH